MGVSLLVGRLVLAITFAVAGITKLLDPQNVRTAISEFGIPNALIGTVSVVLPIAELVTAALLIPATTAGWGAAGAIALLAIFIVGISAAMARGRRPDCRCFGQVHSSPVGVRTILRNAVLAGIGGFVLWGGVTGRNRAVNKSGGHMTTDEWLIGAAFLVIAAALAVVIWLGINLARQQGRLLLRIEALENAASQSGSAPSAATANVREMAPAFELPGIYGERLTLKALLAQRRPVMVVFTDPACGPCNELMPSIADWQTRYRRDLTIAVISRGSEQANIAKAEAHGFSSVLLQTNYEISDAYGVTGTPSAVIVDLDGRLASDIAAGPKAITELVEATTSGTPEPAVPAAPATPPAPVAVVAGQGALAPDFTLPDVNETPTSLHQFRGRSTMLLFWDTHCGFCNRMLDDLRTWESTAAAAAQQLVLVSLSNTQENKAMGLRAPVLSDPGNRIAPTFGVNGTPIAVMVDAEGRVASEIAAGAEAVWSLARDHQAKSVNGN